jgi:hypothetical protein
MFKPLTGLQHAKGFSTSPTINSRLSQIGMNEVEDLLDALSKITLEPFVSSKLFGVDGETFGIETFGFHASRITWWCTGPLEWAPLTEWSDQMRELLSGCFDTAAQINGGNSNE